MSNIKSIKFMPRWLHQEMQAIENALKNATVISKQDHNGMTQRLDAILKDISDSASPFASAMQEQTVTLYGRVEDAWVEREATLIGDEAARLKNAIKSGRVTAEAVDELAAHIGAFRQGHLPSRKVRQLLRKADQIVELASSALSNNLTQLPEITESTQPLGEIDGYVLGEMEELMDLAGLVYNGKKTEARTRFAALSESIKKNFLSALAQMGATPFDDWMETCQVFLMLAYQTVGTDDELPTEEHVTEFFEGLNEVLQVEEEELMGPKTASLSGRVSVVGL